MKVIQDDHLEQRARAIFLEALNRSRDEWASFLAAACDGDAKLNARLDQLLTAHLAAGSIHGESVHWSPQTFDVQQAQAALGSLIGPYKLREQIGEGGMGIVYVAEQMEPLRRKVALKVVKPGMDSQEVIARFEAEKQALAVMDHPHVARVIDAGTTEQGRPYFV
ncbi:MAG: protein kinase, partial [Planctomycetaceae bacterium]|nr:protein kinase [Planctomycetaceae bacterium]